MRKLGSIAFLVFCSTLFPDTNLPQQEYEVFVTNIMVPVRVYEGDRFVSDLTLQDLELYEDGQIQELFQTYHREINFDVERLEQAFADSDILFNFIFMDKPPQAISGLSMREQSEDVYRLFASVTAATGGIYDNSQNPAAAFERVSELTESYYVLFYSPKNYTRDGKFKTIEVRVKQRNCKIIHRLGYFAD